MPSIYRSLCWASSPARRWLVWHIKIQMYLQQTANGVYKMIGHVPVLESVASWECFGGCFVVSMCARARERARERTKRAPEGEGSCLRVLLPIAAPFCFNCCSSGFSSFHRCSAMVLPCGCSQLSTRSSQFSARSSQLAAHVYSHSYFHFVFVLYLGPLAFW